MVRECTRDRGRDGRRIGQNPEVGRVARERQKVLRSTAQRLVQACMVLVRRSITLKARYSEVTESISSLPRAQPCITVICVNARENKLESALEEREESRIFVPVRASGSMGKSRMACVYVSTRTGCVRIVK